MIRQSLSKLLLFLILVSIGHGEVDQCRILKKFDGEPVQAQFGNSAESLGDVNSDGVFDYIVGAMYFSGVAPASGKVYVMSGLDGEFLFTFDGEAQEDLFGFWVSSAGDVNNDGINDLLIGVPLYDGAGESSGRVYVFSGADGDTLFVLSGQRELGFFGLSASGAGDLNDDSYDDFIVGESIYDSIPGRAYVISGRNGDTLFIFEGEDPYDRFGSFVDGAGDVNKDGYNDLIIGASAWLSDIDFPGKAYVYSGKTGAVIHTFTGEYNHDNFGMSVSSAGNVDNDGYADIIIGAFGYPMGARVGRAYIFSGFSGDTLYIIDAPDIWGNDFALRVSEAGDVNADGYGDFMIGAYFYDLPGVEMAGKVFVYSGFDGSLVAELSGAAQYSSFGIWASPASDVNDDGFDDILVGARWDGESVYYSGNVYVLSIADCFFNRGDVNHDGNDSSILDLNFMVNRIFRSGPAPICSEEADVNADGISVNILDLNFLVNDIFRGGPSAGACY